MTGARCDCIAVVAAALSMPVHTGVIIMRLYLIIIITPIIIITLAVIIIIIHIDLLRYV